ncbi:MAG: FtsX-like permease family protein [Turicibacter sp.]|nr:FtsX-like permease family protein [Turicibacter sp.]
MHYLNRAVTSVKRRPGKSVTLLLLLLVLGTIIAGAISIRQAVANTDANLRAQMPAVATITADNEAWNLWWASNPNESPERETVTPELVERIAALPYVEAFSFAMQTQLFSRDLDLVAVNPPEEYIPEWVSEGDLAGFGLRREGAPVENFFLRGSNTAVLFDVEAGLITLHSGRMFTEQEINSGEPVLIISRQFAEQNNLNLGSTVTMENSVWDNTEANESGMWDASERFNDEDLVLQDVIDFEIIGLFEPAVPFDYSNANDFWQTMNDERDLISRIYVPNNLARELFEDLFNATLPLDEWLYENERSVEDALSFDAIFALDDPRNLASFIEQSNEMLPEFTMMGDLSNTFGTVASSMGQMQWIADIVLWVAVGATLLILTLLITLFLRDRKQEIGIYLALGEKRSRVISQILIEVLSVSFIAILLALGTGTIISNNISGQMLENDLIARQQEEMMTTGGWVDIPWQLRPFSPGTMSVEDMLAAYDTSMDPTAVALFFGVGLGTVLLSTLFPIVYITRFDPKKIML